MTVKEMINRLAQFLEEHPECKDYDVVVDGSFEYCDFDYVDIVVNGVTKTIELS